MEFCGLDGIGSLAERNMDEVQFFGITFDNSDLFDDYEEEEEIEQEEEEEFEHINGSSG